MHEEEKIPQLKREDMVDDSLTSHEMKSYSELIKESLVETESQAEA